MRESGQNWGNVSGQIEMKSSILINSSFNLLKSFNFPTFQGKFVNLLQIYSFHFLKFPIFQKLVYHHYCVSVAIHLNFLLKSSNLRISKWPNLR